MCWAPLGGFNGLFFSPCLFLNRIFPRALFVSLSRLSLASLSPLSRPAAAPRVGVQVVWAAVMMVACIPSVMSSVYKEQVRDTQKSGKEEISPCYSLN
jgi:hypothetical protein